jgi:glycerol-3-phosphate dehydrogenase
MIGTTDERCELTEYVEAPKIDIDFIISEAKQIFGKDFNFEENIQSAWAGIRPLVKDT